MSVESVTENNTCSICLNDLENDLITLPCKHTFHQSCMDQWKTYQENCPYCRTSLVQNRIPRQLFDELIGQDGNIDQLTVDNFNHFYYINTGAFNNTQRSQYIDKIKQAKIYKSSLILYRNYNITGELLGKPSFGKLIKISQIRYDGFFTCEFQTCEGIEVYFTNMNSFHLA